MSKKVIFQPSKSVVAQIAQLPDMDIEEIKSLWRKVYRSEPPTHIQPFLNAGWLTGCKNKNSGELIRPKRIKTTAELRPSCRRGRSRYAIATHSRSLGQFYLGFTVMKSIA